MEFLCPPLPRAPTGLKAISKVIPPDRFRLTPRPPAAPATRPGMCCPEHIKDLIILTDLNGDLIFYVSPSCRNFGYSQMELVGRRAIDFLHPEDLAPGQQDASLLSTEEERSRESRRERRFRRKDGAWVWLEGNPSTLEGAPGAAVGRLNVFRDVTQRRADREALAEHARRAARWPNSGRRRLLAARRDDPGSELVAADLPHARPGDRVHRGRLSTPWTWSIRTTRRPRTSASRAASPPAKAGPIRRRGSWPRMARFAISAGGAFARPTPKARSSPSSARSWTSPTR